MRLVEVKFKMGTLYIDEGDIGCILRLGDAWVVLLDAAEVKQLEEALAETRARLEAVK